MAKKRYEFPPNTIISIDSNQNESSTPNILPTSKLPINSVLATDGQGNITAGTITFSGASSTNLIYTSLRGAVSDADLSFGSTTFGTDNTTILQSILDVALTKPIKIIVDGKYSTSGLTIHGNTTIECLAGCGFILRSGSNTPLIINGNYQITESGATDNDITLIGGIYNGNGVNQTHSNANGWNSGIRIYGSKRFIARDITVVNTRTFGIHLLCAFDYILENITINNSLSALNNNDGIHITGPSARGVMQTLKIANKDDKVTLNSDELGPNSNDSLYAIYAPTVCYGGLIENIVIKDLMCTGGAEGIRLLSTANRINNILIDGVFGKSSAVGFIIDNYSENPGQITNVGPGYVENVTINNVSLELFTTGYKNCYFYLNTTVNNLKINNVSRGVYTAAMPTMFFDTNFKSTYVKIDGFYSNNTGATATLSDIYFRGAVDVLELNNFNFNKTQTYGTTASTISPIVFDTSGSIGKLLLNNINVPYYDSFISVQASANIKEIFVNTLRHLSLKNGAYTISTASPYSGYLSVSNYYGQQLINAFDGSSYSNVNYNNPLSKSTYYNFELSGSTISDQGPNGNNLTLVNGPTQTAGKVGFGYNFQASSSQRMFVNSNSSITGFNELGFACWVNFNTTTGTQAIVSKYSTVASTSEFVLYTFNGVVQIGMSSNGSTLLTSNPAFYTVSTNTWYFMVVNYSKGVGSLDIYTSSGYVGNTTLNVGSVSTPLFTSTNPLTLGASSNGAIYLDGKLDEVVIRKSAFSLEEKNALWNGGNGVTYIPSGGTTTIPYATLNSNTFTGQQTFWGSFTGTTGVASAITVNSMVTLSSGNTIGHLLNVGGNLVAGGNNQILTGLHVAPIFNNGSFTGVTNNLINLGGKFRVNSGGTVNVTNFNTSGIIKNDALGNLFSSGLTISDLPVLSPSYSASGGTVSSGNTYEQAISKLDGNVQNINKQVGTIFSDDFTNVNTFTNNYTITGGAFSTSIISGGTGTYTSLARWKSIRQSSNKITAKFRYQVTTLNTAGLCLIIESLPSSGNNTIVHLDTTTASTATLKYLGANGSVDFSSYITSTLKTFPVALNNIIEVSFDAFNDLTIVTAKNITTGDYIEIQYKFNLGSGFISATNQVNHGYISIGSVGGAHIPIKFSCIEKSIASPKYIWIGDSISRSYNAFDFSYGFISILREMGIDITLNAGHGNKITDFDNVESFNFIEKLDPSKQSELVYFIGSNDISAGSVTANADFNSLYNRGIASGRIVRIINILDRIGFTSGVTNFNNNLLITYSGDTIINVNKELPNNIINFADGTHPNPDGFDRLAKFFYDKLASTSNKGFVKSQTQRDVLYKIATKFDGKYLTLTSAINTSQKTIPLTLSTDFAKNGFAYIRNSSNVYEIMQYNSNSGVGLDGVDRGLFGTIPTAFGTSDRIHNIIDLQASAENGNISYMSRGVSPGGTATTGFFWNSPRSYNNDQDQYIFGLATSGLFRIAATTDNVLILTKGSASANSYITFNSFSGILTPTAGYYLNHTSNDQFTLNASTTNFTLWTGRQNGNFIIGSTTDVYRTTNGGSDISAQITFDTARSLTSGSAIVMDNANGLVFTNANGILRIATSAVKTTNIITTAGSESSDLSFYTKPTASILTEVFRITSTGRLGIGLSAPLATLHTNGSLASRPFRTSATTVSMDTSNRSWFYAGNTGSTWTLPFISGSTGVEYFVKNTSQTGGANLTLITQGSDQIFFTTPVSNLPISPGNGFIVQNDGVYWQIM